MKLNSSFYVIILMIILFSCKKDNDETPTSHSLIPEKYRDWFLNYSEDDVINFKDDNAISKTFEADKPYIGYTRDAGEERHDSIYNLESFQQSFYSSTSGSFSYHIYAPSTLYLTLNELWVSYNLDKETLTQVKSSNNYWKTKPPFNSTFEKMDSVSIGDSSYTQDIYHFELKNDEGYWNETTVTHFYIQKGKGLLKYTMANGINVSIQE